jgi:hypothetical protein
MKISHETTHNEIYNQLAKLMRKEQVAIKKDDKNTKYITAIKNNRILGCVGYQKIGNTIRYKTDFTHPNYRGIGIYKQLFKERDNIIGNNKITAFCTSKSIGTFLNNGFGVQRVGKNGIKYVVRSKQNGTT